MSISLIHDNYFPKFVPVNFLIQGNVTTIHKFGLIKVTATITPVDSESQNYVDGKVETSGLSITITQVRKSTDKN